MRSAVWYRADRLPAFPSLSDFSSCFCIARKPIVFPAMATVGGIKDALTRHFARPSGYARKETSSC